MTQENRGTRSEVMPPDEHFNFAKHLLDLNRSRGSKLAFVDDVEQLSYDALSNKVRSFASALISGGLRREDRILLVMQDVTDWPVAFLGSIYAGVIPVAVNTLLTADDYAYMLEHSRSQAIITSGSLIDKLREALGKAPHEVKKIVVSRPEKALDINEVDLSTFLENAQPNEGAAKSKADDPCFWLYSSGSTGRPKGTVHTHANPYWTSELYGRNCLGVKESDVCFSAAKLFFAYGLGNALTFPMSVGATAILMPERPTPEAVFKRLTGKIAGLKPTLFFGAPTGLAGMLASEQLPTRDEVGLRLASSAGEALPSDLGERFTKHFGVDVVDGIGSTEMLHIFLSNRPGKVQYGTTGWPVPGYEIELRGEDGMPVQDGEIGDLYISGPSAALMYWGNRDKSRDTFQGIWTKSGDKYSRNADGTYTYSGRSDDMLKVSGIYVSPFEIESTLSQHAEVLEAAVVGIVDEDGLTKTKAFVVKTPGSQVTESDLKAFVKDKLAPYKYPRQIEFVGELPKTATGKIQRFKLRTSGGMA
jgi:benzoate-CoA ligase